MSYKNAEAAVELASLNDIPGLNRPLGNLVADLVPERRGPADDATEAPLQGIVRMVAVIFASAVVRGLAERRR